VGGLIAPVVGFPWVGEWHGSSKDSSGGLATLPLDFLWFSETAVGFPEDFTLPPLFPWESNRLRWSLMDSDGLPWDSRWHRDKPTFAVS
jgi:hypothetical protein